MRELTTEEIKQVAGGDGMMLPGGGYISTTSRIMNGLGLFGAATIAFEVGYAAGSAINDAVENNFGGNIGDYAYGYFHGS